MTEPLRDDELEFHLEMLTRRYLEEGLTPDAARRKARERMGDLHAAARERTALARTQERRDNHTHWWEGLAQDGRHAWQTLRRSPAFVLLSVMMIGLGTGAATTVFSVVDAVLLRSPFFDPKSLVTVHVRQPSGTLSSAIPRELYDRLAANPPHHISAVGMFTIASPIATEIPVPRRTRTECLSADMVTVLATPPVMGRWFGDEDARAGAPAVAVASHSFWRGALGGDPNVVGRVIRLATEPVTVIGVMAAGFNGPLSRVERDLWLPYGPNAAAALRIGCRPIGETVNLLGRLRPGIRTDTAIGALATIDPSLAVISLDDRTVGDVRNPFSAAGGAVIAVLLIAFANVTNLGLERLARRRQEVAVRLALGATRGRIMRETLAEHVIVSLIGAGAGIGVALLSFDAVIGLLPPMPNLETAALNARVLATSLGLVVVGALVTGTFASWHVSSSVMHTGMASGDRAYTFGNHMARRAIVSAELALGVLLLVGALLMIRTFLTLRPAEPGFDPTGKHVASVPLPRGTTTTDRLVFMRAVRDDLMTAPGIRGVASTTSVPMRSEVAVLPATIDGATTNLFTGSVTPNYFQMMDIPIRRGRGLLASDTKASNNVAVVNEAFVQRWFPNTVPLGQVVTLDLAADQVVPVTIVGVVGNIRSFGSDTRIRPYLYVPLEQSILGSQFFIIHAEPRVASTVAATMRDVVDRVRPGQLVDTVDLLADDMSASVAHPRLGAWLFGSFAALAVLLGAVGLAATLAWSVARRRKEIGIRMALGARPRDVSRLVTGQMLGMAVTGVVLGLLAASLTTGLLEGWLYGITPLDPLTFATCGALMLVVSALAAYIPARRATRVDPVVTLRGDS
jgi:putative ABC transport system permease protein